jgi:hypothetical protein
MSADSPHVAPYRKTGDMERKTMLSLLLRSNRWLFLSLLVNLEPPEISVRSSELK